MIGNPSLSEEKVEKVILKESIGRVLLPGNNKEYLYLPGGSEFYLENNGFQNAGYFLTFDPVCEVHDSKSKITIISTALKYLHSPYLWGGRTVLGIDCSGFIQVVFKMNGINLPRDAHQQAAKGSTINFLDETMPGDLAFFSNADGQIVHTGIIGKNHSIIHASGKVRIDKLDHQGIFNTETNKYSHTLRLIRRMEGLMD